MRMIHTHEDLKQLLQAPDEIEVVVRPHEPFGSGALLAIGERCTALQAFSWINNIDVSEEELLAFFERVTTLRSLNLSSGMHVSSAVVSTFLARSAALRFLDLSFCAIDDSAFASIRAPLRFLNLQGCSILTDVALQQLAKLPSLRHLLLAFNDRITPNGLRAFAPRQLKTLRIHGCRKIESLVA